jgi:hypothetical protein
MTDHTYSVTIYGPREKVKLIKLIRDINLEGGLRRAKELVEENISFEDWMDPTVHFDLLLNDAQLGRLYWHTANNDRWEVTWMMRVDKPKFDIDLTV